MFLLILTIKLFLFLDDKALTGGFSLIKGQSVKKYIKNAENKDFCKSSSKKMFCSRIQRTEANQK